MAIQDTSSNRRFKPQKEGPARKCRPSTTTGIWKLIRKNRYLQEKDEIYFDKTDYLQYRGSHFYLNSSLPILLEELHASGSASVIFDATKRMPSTFMRACIQGSGRT